MGCWTPTICDNNHYKGSDGSDRKGGEVPASIKRPKPRNRPTIGMETKRPECCTDIEAYRGKGLNKAMRNRCGVERDGFLTGHMGLRIRGDHSGGGSEKEREKRDEGTGNGERGRGLWGETVF